MYSNLCSHTHYNFCVHPYPVCMLAQLISKRWQSASNDSKPNALTRNKQTPTHTHTHTLHTITQSDEWSHRCYAHSVNFCRSYCGSAINVQFLLPRCRQHAADFRRRRGVRGARPIGRRIARRRHWCA